MDSVSPITGKTYQIPHTLNDRTEIDSFLNRNQGKKVVVVQGLGFVGSVMSLVVANAISEEYAVLGIDLPTKESFWKIASINQGEFPVVSSDNKVEEYFKNAVKKENLMATFDPYAYEIADVIIVDINLDVEKQSSEERDLIDFDLDLTPFTGAIKTIGNHCKEGTLILVETTVPPGTCEKVVKPILDNCFSLREMNGRYYLGHSYERVMPGPNYIDSIQNFYRVYSGIDEESKELTEEFLKTIIYTNEYPLTCLGTTNASEMAKVLENSYRAMNIAFIDEWTKFAEEAEVNLHEVVHTIRMRPTHKNIMLPGLGVGGYCLPKDPLLASWSKTNLFKSDSGLPQSERAVEINDKMPSHSFEVLTNNIDKNFAECTVAILGISYLSNVGDTRYTPVDLLYDKLKSKNCKIFLHDPHVNFWEEKSLYTERDIDSIFSHDLDIIIFGTGHNEYRSSAHLHKLIQNQKKVLILDTMSLLSDTEINHFNRKHVVKVLGRGDI